MEYSCVAGNGEASEITDWQSNATFNGLSPQTTYTFYARYAGDDKFYNASPASNGLSVTTLPTAPESSAVTIDYAVETISFDSSTLEMSTSEDFTSGTAISSGGSVEAYMGQTVYVRVKAVNDIPASTPTAITIPARPDAPTLTIDNQTEGVTIPDGYSYNTTSADYSNTWTQCTGALVHIDPSATIYIYKAAVTSGEASAFKSQVQTITAPARSENPTAPTIDYQQETLTTSTTLQCSTDKGTTWTTCTDNMTLAALDWTGGEMDVQFRTAATTGTDGKYASDPVSLTIPSRPAAPTGLTATEETCIDGKDGKITGVTTDMEYKLSTADVWIDCTDIEITGLAPGTYQVRLAATETAFAGEEASVTIEEVVEIQIDKSESSIELGSEGVVLTATITGIDDVNKAENWIWTSSNDKVAEVIRLTPEADVLTTRSTYSPIESTARVTPVGEGTATITVTYTGTKYMATKTYDITVKAKEEEPAPKPDPTPIYYNIQFEDICEGVDASLSKSVVKAGNQVSVYVEVEEGYDGENLKVLFKRSLYGYWEEVEEGVQPGEYIIYNVYDDIYVKVEGVEKIEEDPTGMSDIEGTKVYAQNGSLYVYTSQPQEVMIITMNGTILKRERQEGLQSYSLPKGVYIICIGEQTFKVRN